MVVVEISPHFSCQILSATNRFTHTSIGIQLNELLGRLLYGYHHQHLQKQLQKKFPNLFANLDKPWLIIGDLNELFSPGEQNCTSLGSSTRYNIFNNFINQITLLIQVVYSLGITKVNTRMQQLLDQVVLQLIICGLLLILMLCLTIYHLWNHDPIFLNLTQSAKTSPGFI